MIRRAVFFLFLSLVVTASALATPIVDFGIIAPTPGVLSYAGGAAPLVGSGIQIDNVVGLGTPLHNGLARNILSGVLNFQTGALTYADPTTYRFAGGGNLTITGCADLNNNHVCDAGDATSPLLYNGNFTSVSVTRTAGKFRLVAAAFLDLSNHTLSTFYGLGGASHWQGALNLSFTVANSTFRPPQRFTSTAALSGDIVNQPVPEPSSLLLIGVGLLAAHRLRRTR